MVNVMRRGMPIFKPILTQRETILTLAPETNGEVAVKAWAALSKITRA